MYTTGFALKEMSPGDLDLHIRKLKVALLDAEAESAQRQGGHAYRCEVCGYTDRGQQTVFRHVQKVHRYPEEDASLSTHHIYT